MRSTDHCQFSFFAVCYVETVNVLVRVVSTGFAFSKPMRKIDTRKALFVTTEIYRCEVFMQLDELTCGANEIASDWQIDTSEVSNDMCASQQQPLPNRTTSH